MAIGANRGAWYTGLMGPLADGGIQFEMEVFSNRV